MGVGLDMARLFNEGYVEYLRIEDDYFVIGFTFYNEKLENNGHFILSRFKKVYEIVNKYKFKDMTIDPNEHKVYIEFYRDECR